VMRSLNFIGQGLKTPSVGGDEKEYARFILEKIEEFEFDKSEIYEFASNRSNVWGVLKGSGGGHKLLLQGLTDTVGVEGWSERLKGTERENPFSLHSETQSNRGRSHLRS
jgi:acetylornithine deacetylase/succinyl-diaminopimelate desuccinylase-like protein